MGSEGPGLSESGHLPWAGPLLGSQFPGEASPSPLMCPQILGLTFAMTMYCQVVKADTYCA